MSIWPPPPDRLRPAPGPGYRRAVPVPQRAAPRRRAIRAGRLGPPRAAAGAPHLDQPPVRPGLGRARRGVGPRQVRRYLKRKGARYRRTAHSLWHKQDPAEAKRAAQVPDNLESRAAAGRLTLYYLDECGFAHAAGRQQMGPPGRAEARALRGPAGPTSQRPGGLLAPRRGWKSSRPSGPGSGTTCWPSCTRCRGRRCRGWWSWTTAAARRPPRTPGAARAGRWGLFLYFLPTYSPELNRVVALSP
jgi:hypothetical protein